MAKKPKKELTFEVLRVALLEKVKALGATQIMCEYSGGGDDGQIDGVSLDVGDLGKGEPATWFVDAGMQFDDKLGKFVPIEAHVEELPLEKAVEAYCYSVIEKNHPGDWVNNEGGGGTLTISLTLPPKVKLECYDNVTARQCWEIDCETGEVDDLGTSIE